MAQAQETKTATEMQTAEMEMFKRLLDAGYSRNQANGLINLAKTQLAGGNVTVSSENPFTRNLALGDINSVAKALSAVKKNPDARTEIVTKLDIKGPQKETSVQTGSKQLTGFLCSVKIGDHNYTAQLTAPLAPKDVKQQLSELLKTGGVLQVTEFNTVTGQDVAVTNSKFQEAYNRALSEDPARVSVKAMKRG
jgi:hypothetical protein